MTTTHIIALTEDQLEGLMTRAAKRAIELHDKGDELTLDESAKVIRRRRGDLRAACLDGTLPAVKDGKAWRINRKDLLAWNRATPRGKA